MVGSLEPVGETRSFKIPNSTIRYHKHNHGPCTMSFLWSTLIRSPEIKKMKVTIVKKMGERTSVRGSFFRLRHHGKLSLSKSSKKVSTVCFSELHLHSLHPRSPVTSLSRKQEHRNLFGPFFFRNRPWSTQVKRSPKPLLFVTSV